MAGSSAVVGLLRVLLTANTAEFRTGLLSASGDLKKFSTDLNQVSRQATSIGKSFTAATTLPIVAALGASAKAAIDFESSFAGVRKTVAATEPEFAKLQAQFRDLAKQVPISVNEINKLGETAGALGIPKQAVAEFVKVMAQIGSTTNLSAEQAAESIAKIQNIFGAAGQDTDRFGAALVALGNAGASTEAEIVDMATRIAGAGHAVGLSQAEVLGLANGLTSLGLNAEAGGTAISRVMVDMAKAVSEGGHKLQEFARVSGMSAAEFKEAFQTDAAHAVVAFTEGLGRVKQSGGDIFRVLADLGESNVRVRDTLLRAAGGASLLREQLDLGISAWKDNTALAKAAEERYKTTAAQLTILWNRITDVGITLGNALLPAIKSLIGLLGSALPLVDGLARGFASLPGPIQLAVLGIAGLVAAMGPALFLFGQLTSSAAALATAFTAKGLATRAMSAIFGDVAVAATTVGTATEAAAVSTGLFGSALALLTNPLTLLAVGLGIAAFAIYKVVTAESDLQKSLRESSDTFRQQTSGLQAALATYDRLKDQQHLTAQETKDLDAATRALAGASGLSKDAFQQEERTSKTLTDELRKQLQARKDLYDEAIRQSREAAQKAQGDLQNAQAQLQKVLSGQATKVEVAGPGAAPSIRPLNVDERVKEVQRLNGEIASLTTTVEAAKTALAKLTGGATADVNLASEGVANTAGGAAAKVSELDQLTKRYQADLQKIGASGFKEIQTAHQQFGQSIKELATNYGVAESSIERFLFSANETKQALEVTEGPLTKFTHGAQQLEQQLKAAAEAGVPAQIVLEEYGNQIDEIGHKAPIFAKLMGEFTQQAFDDKQTKKAADELAKFRQEQEKTFSEGRNAILEHGIQKMEAYADATKKNADATRDAKRATEEFEHAFDTPTLANQLEGISRKYQDLQDNIKDTEKDAGLYTQRVMALGEQEAGERRVVTEAWLRGNALTKEDLRTLADDAKIRYEAMLKSGRFTADQLAEAFKKWHDLEDAALDGMKAKFESVFRDILSNLPDTLAQAFASGGGWEAAGAAIGTQLANGIKKALASQLTSSQQTAVGVGAAVPTAVAGATGGGKEAAAVSQAATTAGPLVSALAGGGALATGVATLGIGFGVWAGIELVKYLKGAEARRIVSDIGQNWGIQISEAMGKELAKQIKATEKTISGGTKDQRRQWAELLNIGNLEQAAGGLTTGNLAKFERQAVGLFEVIQRGGETGKEALSVLNDQVSQFGAAAEKTGGLWDPVLQAMIQRSKDLGLNLAAIGQLVDAQASKLGAGLASLTTGAFSGTDKRVAALTKDLTPEQAAALPHPEQSKKLLKDLDGSDANRYQMAIVGFKQASVGAQDSLDRLSRIALASFNSIVAGGKSAFEAIEAIGPSIDQLIAEHDKLGLSGSAAYDQLARLRTLTAGNADLVASVSGLNDVMTALSNLGGLDADTFKDLQTQGLQAFQQLTDAGFTQDEALTAMKPLLENIIKLHNDRGLAIDDETQKLVDQGKAKGILQDQIDMQDILLEGFGALITALGGELPEAFKKFRKAGTDAANDVSGAIDKIPRDVTIDVTRRERKETIPSEESSSAPSATGGLVTAAGVQHLSSGGVVAAFGMGAATGPVAPSTPTGSLGGVPMPTGGTFVPQGTDTVPAMLTPGEVVLTEAQQQALDAALQQREELLQTFRKVEAAAAQLAAAIDAVVQLEQASAAATQTATGSIQDATDHLQHLAGSAARPPVVSHFANGGPVFTPTGTDTVPAMLTPNEGIVTVGGMGRLEPAGLKALNHGRPLPMRVLRTLAGSGAFAASMMLSAGMSHFASGGIVGLPSLTSLPLDLAAPPIPDLVALNQALTPTSAATMGAGSAGGRQSLRATTIMQVNRRELGRAVADVLPGEARRLGVKVRS